MITALLATSTLGVTTLFGLGMFILYSVLAIGLLVIGYKLFDKATPGDMHGEIFEQKNTAVAILAGSVLVGLSIILAAAIIG